MANTELSQTFQYTITDIRVVSFAANESILSKDEDKPAHLQFNYKLSFKLEKDVLVFCLKTVYYYEDLTPDNPLAHIEVENHFYIEDLNKRVDGDDVTLPNGLWITILSMSITHTRALFAHYLANTDIKIMPVINTIDVAKVFFPNLFLEPIKE